MLCGIGMGLSAGVIPEIAGVISFVFSAVVVGMWYLRLRPRARRARGQARGGDARARARARQPHRHVRRAHGRRSLQVARPRSARGHRRPGVAAPKAQRAGPRRRTTRRHARGLQHAAAHSHGLARRASRHHRAGIRKPVQALALRRCAARGRRHAHRWSTRSSSAAPSRRASSATRCARWPRIISCDWSCDELAEPNSLPRARVARRERASPRRARGRSACSAPTRR